MDSYQQAILSYQQDRVEGDSHYQAICGEWRFQGDQGKGGGIAGFKPVPRNSI